ncbi:extracellular catalytic domain type 2 short-chain-length polyhydroxyalkanoate depolymerase [Roseateles albus]|uniref:Depolymerase n=1 Tax=Roseateles albus TaxID=2987525 RepID=A0ABT5KEM3_9BURK|nr:PHB depolymerase family esterase [Roseateles albus]MDC8772374.1 depolymerase [Roseateles albus]
MRIVINNLARTGLSVGVLTLLAGLHSAWAADSLPAVQAAADRTSISGLSSGAFMAVQYSTAYSASVMGVGVVAGGPYNCAYVNLGGILTCMSGAPSGGLSWEAAQDFASFGQIDPVAAISKFKVYVYGGKHDTVVHPSVVKATKDFYTAGGVAKKNLTFVSTLPSGHAFISPDFGNACKVTESPYIAQCKVKGSPYDQAKAILSQIYGPLKPAVLTLSSTVRPFDQREFAAADTGLDKVGFYYLPKACAADKSSHCAVHVVFHGCEQGAAAVGSDVYSKVGYNRWADANQVIVLYPQVVATELPLNPKGCWDWWGYSGLNFQVRGGAQLHAVKSMVDRLISAP